MIYNSNPTLGFNGKDVAPKVTEYNMQFKPWNVTKSMPAGPVFKDDSRVAEKPKKKGKADKSKVRAPRK